MLDENYYNPIDAELEEEQLAVEDEVGEEQDEAVEDAAEQLQDAMGDESGEEGEEDVEDEDPIDKLIRQYTSVEPKKQEQVQAPSNEEYQLLNTIKNSDLTKAIVKLKTQGYSDEQIQQAMGLAYSRTYGKQQQQQSNYEEEEQQQGIDLTDPNQLASFIQQQVQQYVNPLAQQQQQQLALAQQQKISSNNDKVLLTSLNKIGKTSELTPEEVQAVQLTVQNIYPGIDFTKTALTQAQSDYIIAISLGQKMKAQKSAKAINKNLNAPNIASGKATSTAKGGASIATKINGLSKTERAQRVNQFLKPLGV